MRTEPDFPAPDLGKIVAGIILVDWGNTANATLLVLRAKRYKLWREDFREGDRYTSTLFHAERDGNHFQAVDVLPLLGLVALWENRGDNWGTDKEHEPDVYEELLDNSVIRQEQEEVDEGSEEL